MKKILKSSVIVALFAVIATMGSAFKTNTTTESTLTKTNFFTTTYYTWTGLDFIVGGTTSSTALNTSSNWDGGSSSAPSCPSPFDKLCAAQVEYTGTPAPTKQQVIDAIKAEYDRLAPQTFTNGYSWTVTIGGVSVTITIRLKS